MSSSRVISTDFDYHMTETLEEALIQLGRAGSRILAGGTDILNRIKTGEIHPQALVCVTEIPDLKGYALRDGLWIGAACRLYELEQEPAIRHRYTALFEAIKSLGSVQIRNMATVVGNLCNGSPSADTATPLIVLRAEVEIASIGPGGKVQRRQVHLEGFFTGPGETVLLPGEIVTGIRVPEPVAGSGSAFSKINRVTMDMAKISCSVFLRKEGDKIQKIRVSIGGAAPTPVRALGVEEVLNGKVFSLETLQEACRRLEESLTPITDVRSTREYRREVARVLVRDTFLEAWERCREGSKG